MDSIASLIPKISDFLADRQKDKNFGTCKRCDKKVYWSKTKVASHIRSGHCTGTSEEEVHSFREEFVYDTPKTLVHKSKLVDREKTENIFTLKINKDDSPLAKKPKIEKKERTSNHYIVEETYEDDEKIVFEEEEGTGVEEEDGNEKMEILYVQEHQQSTSTSSIISKEDKFIQEVYPNFSGRSKMELIDEILDLKRQNELLRAKVKTYEKTINKLL